MQSISKIRSGLLQSVSTRYRVITNDVSDYVNLLSTETKEEGNRKYYLTKRSDYRSEFSATAVKSK
jgi:hypothetical protein